jgi:hypothetical protein
VGVLLHYYQFEIGALLVFAAVAAFAREPSAAPLRRASRAFAALARRRTAALACCGGLALLVSAGISALRPPVPGVHDEFAYLLAADTFASGRLANPTPPSWPHFETIHVIMEPSYAAKYPPLPGILMALGQVSLGQPIAGVWLAHAAAAAAVCWMLQALVAPRFALVGGLLLALHGNFQLGWGQSFWGGGVTVLASALLFGGAARTMRGGGVAGPLALGLGAAALAATRPYEGALAVLAAGAWVLGRLGPWKTLARVAPLGLAVLLPAVAALLLYNARVTGDPLVTPYQLHEATYATAPLFVWQQPSEPPAYRRDTLERFHTEWSMEAWHAQRTLGGFLRTKGWLLFGAWLYLLGPLLTLPCIAAARRTGAAARHAWASLGFLVAGVLIVTWLQPHYLAVGVPLLLLLAVLGLRKIRAGCRPASRGRLLVVAFLLLYTLGFLHATQRWIALPKTGWAFERARIAEALERAPGQDLVFVRYGPGHDDPLEEWVYNAADLDSAPVIWARTLDPERDGRLRDYFAERRAWVLEVGPGPPRLRPLEGGELATPGAGRPTRR